MREPKLVELPAVSAEFVILRTGAQALLRALGRKRGERFLREWGRMLSAEEAVIMLLPIRPASEHVAVERARAEALNWYRAVLPALFDALPPD